MSATMPLPLSAYQHCQALTKREAKNFYYGFFLLSRPRRMAIYSAYAFARQCDDIADQELPVNEKADLLAAYRRDLDRCLQGQCEDDVFVALHHAIHTYNIPPQYFHQLIDGVEMDITINRYATFQDLYRYCYHVAAVIGLISIEIFGYEDGEEARAYALDLGVALQLTNILRDIQEDAARGRIYLPQDELARCGYTEEQLLRGEVTPALRELILFQAARARQYYERGLRLLPLLSRRSRACVSVMAGIYSRLLDDIEREPEVVYKRRVSLSTGRKLTLAGRALLRSVVA